MRGKAGERRIEDEGRAEPTPLLIPYSRVVPGSPDGLPPGHAALSLLCSYLIYIFMQCIGPGLSCNFTFFTP